MCWIALLAQKIRVCASDKSWYHGHRPQQCPVGEASVVLQLVSTSSASIYRREPCQYFHPADIFADLTLAILPITMIRRAMIPACQRKCVHYSQDRYPWLNARHASRMLIVIFSASLLTTIVSILYAIVLLGPRGALEGVVVQAEVTFVHGAQLLGILTLWISAGCHFPPCGQCRSPRYFRISSPPRFGGY